jgi:hypothetical protein
VLDEANAAAGRSTKLILRARARSNLERFGAPDCLYNRTIIDQLPFVSFRIKTKPVPLDKVFITHTYYITQLLSN